MKLSITNKREEVVDGTYFVPAALFSNIVAILQRYGIFQPAVEQHVQSDACNRTQSIIPYTHEYCYECGHSKFNHAIGLKGDVCYLSLGYRCLLERI